MIQDFAVGQEKEISTLIQTVFDRFVGYEYSREGNEVFSDFIRPEKILQRYGNGNIIKTFKENGKILGMIEVQDLYHICLFFVAADYQNRSIGKKLLQAICESVKGRTTFLEVNASPFSIPIYERLGFSKTGEMRETNGITYTPMKMLL